MKFRSTKTFTHSLGLSSCFRQWKAKSHCQFMHGYSLQVHVEFEATRLDERGWVVDFGGLKPIKQWLAEIFDHKTLVARDDPHLSTFLDLHSKGIIDLVLVDAVGCERFAELIFQRVEKFICSSEYDGRVIVTKVEVSEHPGNSAIVIRSID